MRKAAIYARYSSDHQKEESIEQQVEICRDYAAQHDLEIVEVYADRAVTGRRENRAAFQRLLRDAEKEKFQVVLAYKSSRIARNMLNALSFEAKMDRHHIETLYAREEFGNTPTGRFMLRSMMNINQWYSENLAEDVMRGMEASARDCKILGVIPYGYQKGPDGKYVIYEPEAAVVREIFQSVADGVPYVRIIESLNNRGIRNKRGNEWKKMSFEKILKNENYIGVYTWNGTRIEGGVPRILDTALFQAAQDRVHRVQEVKGRKSQTNEYLLTGKLFCGHCGSAMIGVSGTGRNGSHHYYACQGRLHKTCNKSNVRQDWLEDLVISAVLKYMLSDESIDWIVEQFIEYKNDSEEAQEIQLMQDRLQEIDTEIGNFLKAISIGVIHEIVQNRLTDLQQEKTELQNRIDRRVARLKSVDPDRIRYGLERIRSGDIKTPAFRRSLIQQFVQRIVLYDNEIRIGYTIGDFSEVITLEQIEETVENPEASVRISSDLVHQHMTIRTGCVYYRRFTAVLVLKFESAV